MKTWQVVFLENVVIPIKRMTQSPTNFGFFELFDIFQPQSEEGTFRYVRLANIQISLRIRAVWSESSLGAFWIDKDAVSSRVQRWLIRLHECTG